MTTKMTCGFLSIIAMMLGCSYESTRTSNYDMSFSNTSVKPTSTASSPSPSQPNYLTVTSDDVSSAQAAVDSTNKALTRIEDEITTAEIALANANRQQSLIPSQIEALRLKVAHLAAESRSAETLLATAERAYATFAETIELRKAKAKHSLAASLTQKYEQTVADIKLAQQKRDELRTQIGASRDEQSEAQLQSLRIQQARQYAQETYVSMLHREHKNIDGETASLMSRIASAKDHLNSIVQERHSNEQLILTKNDELIAAVTTVASLPPTLARLQRDRSRLTAAQLEQSNSLRFALAALQKKNELLADQKRQQELRNQRSAPLVAASLPSPQYFVSTASTRSINPVYSSSVPRSRNATGRYYNYNYRPPVGDHYVRSHLRSDGTYVSGHRRTDADDSYWNNWSSYGNINPYTGQRGSKRPSYSYGGGSTYVRGYVRSNGTHVSGHYRNN